MFKSESRWDRHLPSESYNEEAIEVAAIFKQGKIFPRWFVWKERKYAVKEITYTWMDRRGDEALYFFSLSDGINIFQIYFNTKYIHWRMHGTPTS